MFVSSGRHLCFRNVQIVLDAVTDVRGGGFHVVPGRAYVSGGRLDLHVTRRFSDHRQSCARGQGPLSKDMPY